MNIRSDSVIYMVGCWQFAFKSMIEACFLIILFIFFIIYFLLWLLDHLESINKVLIFINKPTFK
jgi:hypothetical protein